jgi:hypothetical protein
MNRFPVRLDIVESLVGSQLQRRLNALQPRGQRNRNAPAIGSTNDRSFPERSTVISVNMTLVNVAGRSGVLAFAMSEPVGQWTKGEATSPKTSAS